MLRKFRWVHERSEVHGYFIAAFNEFCSFLTHILIVVMQLLKKSAKKHSIVKHFRFTCKNFKIFSCSQVFTTKEKQNGYTICCYALHQTEAFNGVAFSVRRQTSPVNKRIINFIMLWPWKDDHVKRSERLLNACSANRIYAYFGAQSADTAHTKTVCGDSRESSFVFKENINISLMIANSSTTHDFPSEKSCKMLKLLIRYCSTEERFPVGILAYTFHFLRIVDCLTLDIALHLSNLSNSFC